MNQETERHSLLLFVLSVPQKINFVKILTEGWMAHVGQICTAKELD